MQKTYCDLCGSEIKNGTLSGGVMRQVEKFPLETLPNLFPSDSKRVSQILRKVVEPEIWDLCENCQKGIWQEIEQEQKSLREQRSDLVLISQLLKPVSNENEKLNKITGKYQTSN